ncbi:MAG TPA: radical SAM protein [Candidatus Aenigmarchaeota archaeon]|nr:radical SAM protein [Candidatus Aenigmarchaeota archaeon]
MHEADLVANTVNKWLGNPISRRFLRWIARREGGSSKLEKALKKYAGEDVELSFQEKFAYLLTKLFIEKGAESFDISKEDVKKAMKESVVRRALVNILEGIGYYGVQRPQTTAAPFLIVWDYTNACNLRCKHCYADAKPSPAPDELTTQEAKRAIDEFEEANVVALAFSGGEPLMRKDFFEVAKYAKEREFYVSVATNGTLINKQTAKKLRETVDYVEISLDGFEKTHDEFRGVPGAWRLATRGIKNCVEEGIDTGVATTITRYNFKEIPKLLEFVENELHAKRFIAFNYVPTRRGKDIVEKDISPQERKELLELLYSKLVTSCPLDTFSTAPQYSVVAAEYVEGPAVATHFTNKQAIELLKGRTKTLTEFIGGCGAGRLYCGMEPNGDIQPCVFIPIKIGNIREERLLDIWHNSPILKLIRDRDSFEGCGTCDYEYICGGCRARAYGYFGDLQGPDPGCWVKPEYWERIKKINRKV